MDASLLNQKPHNHARSNSLPSKSHPLILQCKEHLATLRSSLSTSSSLSLSFKPSCLLDLHGFIENIVQLGTTQEAFAREPQEKWVDELLDGSLRLLDACTSVKDALLHTKECTRELHSIVRRQRRRGEMELLVEAKKFLTSRKVVKKAILKALVNLKRGESKCTSSLTNKDSEMMALLSLLKDGEVITLSVFESLLRYISGTTQSKVGSWKIVSKLIHGKRIASCTLEAEDGNEFAKLEAELQSSLFHTERKSEKVNDLQNRLEKLESRIYELEEGLDFLFRRLIRIRVSLLNILNH
ncbi:uncharacterized protein LOC114723699 [Neltuma alba]|uniref:uncharacterized protein LOC114723699 n=1 Tax=Neltuma alba TaxID=207710 RepID=UPI0010A53E97|nr:uncharacterized protein LOC114723699 [Prosopis alba]